MSKKRKKYLELLKQREKIGQNVRRKELEALISRSRGHEGHKGREEHKEIPKQSQSEISKHHKILVKHQVKHLAKHQNLVHHNHSVQHASHHAPRNIPVTHSEHSDKNHQRVFRILQPMDKSIDKKEASVNILESYSIEIDGAKVNVSIERGVSGLIYH